jgi:hypothetical protein
MNNINKTLQECKDEVAKAWQYESWEQATNISSLKLLKHVKNLNDEASELYLLSNKAFNISDLKEAFDAGYARGDGQNEFNGESRAPSFDQWITNRFQKLASKPPKAGD